MLTGFFLITTLICGFRWLTNSIATETLIYYIKKKGYTPPTDKELKEYTRLIAKRRFKLHQTEI